MTTKPEILAMLRSEFDQWEGVLNSLSEEQITAPKFISEWSIQDTVAHLMAWQTRSIAQLEAAEQLHLDDRLLHHLHDTLGGAV